MISFLGFFETVLKVTAIKAVNADRSFPKASYKLS